MKNLQQENVDGGHWIQNPIAPRLMQLATDLDNSVRGHGFGHISLELTHDLGGYSGPSLASCWNGLLSTLHFDRRPFRRQEHYSYVQQTQSFVANLMAFVNVRFVFFNPSSPAHFCPHCRNVGTPE